MVEIPSNNHPTRDTPTVPSGFTALTEVTSVTGRFGRDTDVPLTRRIAVDVPAVKSHSASARN
jgi:hypothetical protein